MPLNQGLKDRNGFFLVSVLLLGLPTLRTNLSLVKNTCKLCIANNFPLKYCIIIKVEYDLLLCPPYVQHITNNCACASGKRGD